MLSALPDIVQNKYVAILRDHDIDQSLPIYIKSKYALNWADEGQEDKEFNDLLLYLYNHLKLHPRHYLLQGSKQYQACRYHHQTLQAHSP